MTDDVRVKRILKGRTYMMGAENTASHTDEIPAIEALRTAAAEAGFRIEAVDQYMPANVHEIKMDDDIPFEEFQAVLDSAATFLGANFYLASVRRITERDAPTKSQTLPSFGVDHPIRDAVKERSFMRTNFRK